MNGDNVLASVAVYEVEAMGMQMIEKFEGDWFTIQGLPLTPVIAFLQHQRFLLS
jgi:septum formation protein